MSDETFKAGKLTILRGEAIMTITKFIPKVKEDVKTLTAGNILAQIAEMFGAERDIDLVSFRLGMYALATEITWREELEDRITAGMRFIV